MMLYHPSSSDGVTGNVLERCLKDVLFLIKPVENDQNKRLYTIEELASSIRSVVSLRGAVVKPFGSFVSNLYSKWGDLDISIDLSSGWNLPINKKRKQNALREIMRVLQRRGVTGHTEFIPQARVPVLQYVSNHYGISCDISINNRPGQIKSKILRWMNDLDERFGDMVLLIKEWAKAQNINDPKTGSLNSYSLCLLVLFHFQTCKPAILPPLKDIYEVNITEDMAEMVFYDEKHLENVCAGNIAKFRYQNAGRTNHSSLCHLLVSFFDKFSEIIALSPYYAICTYTARLEGIDDPRWAAKSYSMLVEDPFERPDNAARAVGAKGLDQISRAISDTRQKLSSASVDRSTLLSLLCRPSVCSQLGVRVIANPYTITPQRSHQHIRNAGFRAGKPFHVQHHNGPVQNQQVERTAHRATTPFQGHQFRRKGYTSEPRASHNQLERVPGGFHNGPTWDPRSQSSSSSSGTWQRQVPAAWATPGK